EENGGNTREVVAAALKRLDRIFEGRRFRVGRDCRGLGCSTSQRGLEGFLKMAWLQSIEGRRFKRPCPWRKQGVFRERIVVIHDAAFQSLPILEGVFLS